MKQKYKPLAKFEIRERVERRFRARGSLRFHLLLVFSAALVLIYNAFDFWVRWDESRSYFNIFSSLRDSVTALCLLGTTAAFHAIHYYFRHGRGRERHEAETDTRVEEQLRRASADDLEEQEELVRLQMADKLKNRRLVFWHLALYLGVMILMLSVHPLNFRLSFGNDWAFWRGPLTFAGIWGIGLLAHLLRYVFAYGAVGETREAKIDQLVEREMRRDRRRRSSSADAPADEGSGISLEEYEGADRQAKSQTEKAR